jgi:PhnB protein
MAKKQARKKVAKKKAVRRKPAKKKPARKVARKARPVAAAPASPLTPYICVKNAADALDFYRKAFGAQELMRITGTDGSIGHAEMQISGAIVFLSDEWPEGGIYSPSTFGGTAVTLHLYVPDVDAFVARASEAQARIVQAIEDKPYGDRAATLIDPYGHRWMVSTKLEDVSKEEMERRFGGAYLVT